MINIIYCYYYFMILAMDKEQWKELWIRKQAKDRGAIEWAINVKSGKIEGEEASDGSWSKRMSDGCYKRSNRRSNGSVDGSRRNSKDIIIMISEQWIGMINRTKLGKIKVTLSINFDVYNILLLLLLLKWCTRWMILYWSVGMILYWSVGMIREGPMDGTSDGSVSDW